MKYFNYFVLFLVIVVVCTRSLLLWYRPDLHVFPSITRCRLCNKRIWIWQSYERREFKIQPMNPENVPLVIKMSGLVHCKCKGLPECKVIVTPNGVSTSSIDVEENLDVTYQEPCKK